ncbi:MULTISPECIES: hypothetical protein [unclassified Mesorhizobium]|uniref:hypothetical protein n=2 Tax=Mesorhizobium TaxID=68287 RepID=UPI000FCBF412|nr:MULTISPECIES: hypothetical protein [unclassified Mesorhizobium]RUV96727.1 hypothetical protein EOA49_25860 [Mesorhizobium sp. M1A.F.Ca.IN.020.04.1.1]RWF71267.1 MAG: hypothetical protein EOQ34_15875 [Mesorhizobium sp.]RWG14801.1 MAG: hypothetical protein EOQ58_13495 [Mesorhizobium sp.]RWG36513.1 MAG: hypothetical protein EOQ61_00715 [Mesorhizobium sp.]RWH13285.1 MAG: hypothetical protein EOQ74_14670 [Mesorhizobium sp.]
MSDLAGFYADDTGLALLGGMTIFVLVGFFLVVRRILIAARRRHQYGYLSESTPIPLDEASWAWDRPRNLAAKAASSRAAVAPAPDVQGLNSGKSGVRKDYLNTTPEAGENSREDLPDAFALATSFAMALPPRVRRPTSPLLRLSVAAICLAVPLGYALTRQKPVESAPAVSRADSYSLPDLSHRLEIPASTASTDAPTNGELPNPDLNAAEAQVEAARAQAAAATELAGQEHRAMEEERARSASLESALAETRKQIEVLKTSMAAADDASEERLRNELVAARTLEALRWIAQDVRARISETIDHVFIQMPAARLERERTEQMARDLAQARAQIEQLEAKAAGDRAKAEASLAQASGMLDEERRKSEDLRGDIAEMEQSKAAIADTAERERTGAAATRARVEQTAAKKAQALAREQASAVAARADLDKARLERDAAKQERAKAVLAKERAERTAAETAQALERERASAISAQEDVNRARLERDAAEQERAKAVTAKVHAEQAATETAQALERERASAVAAREDLDKARLERDAALQERGRAVAAREHAEQTASETAQALERERASAVATREDLDKARLERDAALQERTKAVAAKERAEQSAAETAQALQRERASAVSVGENLNKARLERDTARQLLGQAAMRLKEALDKQREATVSFARELAAARADNDKLRAQRRGAQIEPPLKPRTGRASAGAGQTKAVSQKKSTSSKVRKPSREIRVRAITLPFSLRPSHSTLD